jgi:hypothetical protein
VLPVNARIRAAGRRRKAFVARLQKGSYRFRIDSVLIRNQLVCVLVSTGGGLDCFSGLKVFRTTNRHLFT